MTARFNGRWEGPGHYAWWYEWRTGVEYDRDTDMPAHLLVAWEVMDNVMTCALCVLNIKDHLHPAVAETMRWVEETPFHSSVDFEDKAVEWLEKMEKDHGSPKKQGVQEGRSSPVA